MKAKFALTLLKLVVLLALAPSANPQTLHVLHTFEGADGMGPGALASDRAGNLYGATWGGGMGFCGPRDQCGTVFELSKKNSSWAFATLYQFQDATDGLKPNSPLTVGLEGILYGTTYDQTQDQEGAEGTVFSVRPTCADLGCKQVLWKKTTLYRFDRDHAGHGCYPNGGLVLDKAGNLYGTTQRCYSELQGQWTAGQVYELSPFRSLGDTWNMTVLHHFHGPPHDGKSPYGPVLFDQTGNLYGTTRLGGSTDRGTVYELIRQGSGWTESLLHSFTGSDGGPGGNLVLDSSGSLSGVTQVGAFELTPSQDGWNLSRQYVFQPGQGRPSGGLTMDSVGNLYGATEDGGAYGYGNVYKLTPTDDGWLYSSMYDFTGGSDGSEPNGRLVLDANGNLYGSAFAGGDANCGFGGGCGTVWMITPN